ncbi:hypothetical protein ACX0G9_05150 [Flavitalea flava]
MEKVIVQYKIKPHRVAENETLVRDVYQQLHQVNPPGFSYSTYKLEDGVTFIHIALTDTASGKSPLPGLSAFSAFLENIKDRCDELPVVNQVMEIGSYQTGHPVENLQGR